jgi:predicted Zn-dependent protease
MLPFSRKHESEADYMGLVLMSMAGYNPEVALGFWQKMSASSTTSVPALLSTHPSDAKRIADIKKNLPAIETKYASYINAGKAQNTTEKVTTKKTPTKKKATTSKKRRS